MRAVFYSMVMGKVYFRKVPDTFEVWRRIHGSCVRFSILVFKVLGQQIEAFPILLLVNAEYQ